MGKYANISSIIKKRFENVISLSTVRTLQVSFSFLFRSLYLEILLRLHFQCVPVYIIGNRLAKWLFSSAH